MAPPNLRNEKMGLRPRSNNCMMKCRSREPDQICIERRKDSTPAFGSIKKAVFGWHTALVATRSRKWPIMGPEPHMQGLVEVQQPSWKKERNQLRQHVISSLTKTGVCSFCFSPGKQKKCRLAGGTALGEVARLNRPASAHIHRCPLSLTSRASTGKTSSSPYPLCKCQARGR